MLGPLSAKGASFGSHRFCSKHIPSRQILSFLPDKPEAPKGLRAVEVTSSSVVIEWEAPTSDGGSPVTQYSIERKDGAKGKYKVVDKVDGSTTTTTVKGLSEDKEYYFRVFAENETGKSDGASEMASPVVPTADVRK